MASPRVLTALGGLTVLCLAFFPTLSTPANAQTFLEIADSVRDKNQVVPRPKPQAVPEFIHIAETVNKNKHPSQRPPGSVPDFVLIAESVHTSGVPHRPSAPQVHKPTSVIEVEPVKVPVTHPPPVSVVKPEITDWGDFTRPTSEFEFVTQPMPEAETTTLGEEENENGEDFEEDKIYFEEWEKDEIDIK